MADDVFTTIKHGLEAAEAAVGDVRSVIVSLNTARSCLLTVGNNTTKSLELLSTSHSHGGFSVAPPGLIQSRATGVFGSQSAANSVATGTEGNATYQGDGFQFTVSWDNPFVGGNSSAASLSGPNHNAYRAVATTGVGDQQAPMRYDLFEIEMKGLAVYGAILDKWASLQWAAGPLGFPTSSEADVPDHVGRFNDFEHGMMYWRREIGAFAVWGLIGQRWNQLGREQFGYPVTDETGTPDGVGRFNHFRRFWPDGRTSDASIYWTPQTGAHEVYGAIRDKWASMGWERGQLGYPLEAEHDFQGGRIQHFQHGALFWTSQGGTVIQ
jgi:uncharacterized protein with LGFP repeats